MTDTRAAIIKACAERQDIYHEKRERSLSERDDRRWDEMQMGYEVCTYLLTDILRALDMAPAEIDDDDRIKAA